MTDKDFIFDDVGERHAVETFFADGVEVGGVFGGEFLLETEHGVHVVGFVVATGEEECVGESAFEGKKGEDDFTAEGTSVHEITVKEICPRKRGTLFGLVPKCAGTV